MNEPTLVIMAAGLGSRYGGLKQIDAVGNNGECIIDFSIYDAYRAGFRKLVLIIREEHEPLFEQHVVGKLRPYMDVKYAYQAVTDLPEGFVCPAERTKPWGTVQALLCTKPHVTGPFMVINADDFYGPESYKIMYDFLSNEASGTDWGMVGYQLTKTLTDNGSVTRALCPTDEEGKLIDIVETQKIIRKDEMPYSVNPDGSETLLQDGNCSMNFWGFTTDLYDAFEDLFKQFLTEKINVDKSEYVIPTAIQQLIQEKKCTIKVMSTPSTWFGVTYPQDKEAVIQKLLKAKAVGDYPFNLWG